MFKTVAKTILIIVAPKAFVIAILIGIGAIAEHAEKKRMLQDAEHYANCPSNHA